MNEKVIITKSKIILYCKRFWWIMAVSFLAGLIFFFLGVQNNLKTQERPPAYVQNCLPVQTSEQNQIGSLSVISGNCSVLISAREVQTEINAILERQNIEKIENWSAVTIDNIINSNFFTITVSQKENIAGEQIEAIVQVLNRKMQEYDQGIEILTIGEPVISVTEEEQSVILLKDILGVLAGIVLGCFIVYMIMILDNHIADREEMEEIFPDCEDLCIGKTNRKLFADWLEKLSKSEVPVYIFGDNIKEIEDEIAGLKKQNIILKPVSEYKKAVCNHEERKRYIIVKEMETQIKTLDQIREWNKLYNVRINGWVYIKS